MGTEHAAEGALSAAKATPATHAIACSEDPGSQTVQDLPAGARSGADLNKIGDCPVPAIVQEMVVEDAVSTVTSRGAT